MAIKSKTVKVKGANLLYTLGFLDREVFPEDDLLPPNTITHGHWWIISIKKDTLWEPVAYCGLGRAYTNRGNLLRVGVLKKFRGHGLHRKMLGIRERYARKIGLTRLLTYCAWNNTYSANNLIRSGYLLWEPNNEGKEPPIKTQWLNWYKDLK